MNVTPVSAARGLRAGVIVAVDVKSQVIKWEKPEIAKEIVSRSNYVTGVILNNISIAAADLVVYPAVKQLHWSDFGQIDMIVKEGEKAAAAAIPSIKVRLSWFYFLKVVKDFLGLSKTAPVSA